MFCIIITTNVIVPLSEERREKNYKILVVI
nr:MAG TPA: hypothetical protein [Bacteriophage sp.]